MLQKIRGARQDNASRERQWFQEDYFDLFFWTDAAGKVLAFQLCYDPLRHERRKIGEAGSRLGESPARP